MRELVVVFWIMCYHLLSLNIYGVLSKSRQFQLRVLMHPYKFQKYIPGHSPPRHSSPATKSHTSLAFSYGLKVGQCKLMLDTRTKGWVWLGACARLLAAQISIQDRGMWALYPCKFSWANSKNCGFGRGPSFSPYHLDIHDLFPLIYLIPLTSFNYLQASNVLSSWAGSNIY